MARAAKDHAHSHGHQHEVLFYEEDNKFLCEAILDFCMRALLAGDPLCVIATRPHLDQMKAKLKNRGFDFDAACADGRAAEHEAEQLLGRFCSADGLDPFRFRSVMDAVLGQWSSHQEGRTVRAFGEMVDLLCRKGDLDGAARLEEMWNDLARSHHFTLLCAYSMGNLYREVNGSAYRRIVDAHDHVIRGIAAADEGPARLTV